MTTRATIEGYSDRLRRREGWDAYLADDVAFTSLASPGKTLAGRAAYLEGTRRFYSSIADLDLRELLIDGDRACALTRYLIQPPNGAPAFESHVAECFTVHDRRITAVTICFDTAPYPE